MKKKCIIGFFLLLIALILPIPSGVFKDGGTKVYSSLTYKVVKWKRLNDVDGLYERTRLYFPPDAYLSLDTLWEKEASYVKHQFVGKIVEIDKQKANFTLVPIEKGKQCSISDSFLNDNSFAVGDLVRIIYQGDITNVIHCEKITDFRNFLYSEVWLSEHVKPIESLPTNDLIIKEIYYDCFFATPNDSSSIEYKINGTLHEAWEKGDKVCITYSYAKYDETLQRIEVDMTSIKESTTATP